MEIVNQQPRMKFFGDLSCGDVFKDKNSNICMKLVYYSNVNYTYLSDGELGYLDDNEKVEIVSCQLVLRGD